MLVAAIAAAMCLSQTTPQMTTSDYHGFVRHDFQFEGLAAIVVDPKVNAPGKPWIWRTEFFDHRPELDLALLAKGYHLVHLPVGNTFGAPGPMEKFGDFYHELQSPRWGLNRRVILEGFSRGGLYAYNWAVRNPDKVMAIYGDAPVCDFKTWPYGGQGGSRSDTDWKDLMGAYDFPSDNAALLYPFNPVDSLRPLAIARIPIVHVIGDADELVPIGPNTMLLEKRYRELGGTIQVIHKPGGLHHPHSLDDPTPLVEFLTKHANDSAKSPPATTIPAPNPESRYNSAGWEGRSWMDQFLDGKVAAALPNARLVLLGDSITQGFGGPKRQVGAPGGASYETWLAPFGAANLGISGDRTQHLLWRIENGVLADAHPDVIAIMIGINNHSDDSPENVAKGIEAVARAAQKACPKALVFVQPLMPAGQNVQSPLRTYTDKVNRLLAKLAARKKIRLAFDQNYLLNPDGTQNPNLCSGDGIHLKPAAYAPWAQRLAALMKP